MSIWYDQVSEALTDTGCGSALGGEKLRALSAYWRAISAERAMPARADFEPLRVPTLLPHLVLVDVHRQPLRFRYRLIGTFVTTIAKRDATGRWLDESLYGARTEGMLWPYRHCVEARQPLALHGGVKFADLGWQTLEYLFLPFSDDGAEVNLLVCGIDTAAGLAAFEAKPSPIDADHAMTLLDWRAGSAA